MSDILGLSAVPLEDAPPNDLVLHGVRLFPNGPRVADTIAATRPVQITSETVNVDDLFGPEYAAARERIRVRYDEHVAALHPWQREVLEQVMARMTREYVTGSPAEGRGPLRVVRGGCA